MSGANEIAFPDDFDIKEDKVIAKQYRDYQVHDAYVTCRRCAIRRPAEKMTLFCGVPICVDHEVKFIGPNGWENGLARDHNGNAKVPKVRKLSVEVHLQAGQSFVNATDAPACPGCGSITVRSGSCHKCLNCGSTTGCS